MASKYEYRLLHRVSDTDTWRTLGDVFNSLKSAQTYASVHDRQVIGLINRRHRANNTPHLQIEAQYQIQKRELAPWTNV